MKTNKYISRIVAVTLLLFFAGSCSEDKLDEIDTNPNNPLDVPISLLLPQVITDVSFAISGTDLAWYSSVFVQHTAGVHAQLQAADLRSGNTNNTLVNNTWGTIYATTMPDLNAIITKGSAGGDEEGKFIEVGIAKILKAYTIAIATDAWGRVPYAEIGRGAELRTPKFDNQQEIYTNIQTLLDEAIADLAKGGPSPGQADLIYGGDADSWTKAAWSLKARYYNRLSNIDATGSATQALAAAANGFQSSADNFVFNKFTTQSAGEHPWYQESNDRAHHAVSQTFVNTLDNLNDPRLAVMVAPAPETGEITGAPNGTQTNDQASQLFSDPTEAVLNATSPMPLMTYDELKFIEAEANLRLGNAAGAVTAFTEAVTAAMQRQAPELSNAAITTYVASIASGGLNLESIIRQKWISFWLFQPIEAFNDYRRTGFPALTHPIGPAPLRFPYPQSELDANAANVPSTQITNGVWWDDGTED
ncbi:SusD/RagB family nutrient-binding outer membrane lipoprotein [Pontibacter vulgaris]|uniref:SusD/RagB family nutrient-binding outer membrane lipoprotein n=1 Tax=Pontibacter vulgaris TaxID=2905679 RepID=UPI001FA71D5D|nr:SusD/RagB family nutrient-binding outer membrane lipoprotein [Pontibacter vulgaris]